MNRIFLIIGLCEICRAQDFNGSEMIDKAHFFDERSLEDDSTNEDDGSPLSDFFGERNFQENSTIQDDGSSLSDFSEERSSQENSKNQDDGSTPSNVAAVPDSKNSASNWNYLDQQDSHGFNHISDFSYDHPSSHGLDAWLADIVVGKDSKGFVKPIIHTIGYPVYKDYKIEIPHPQVKQRAQPYPVLVPMVHRVPFKVVKTVVKTVVKKVPTPVEKIVPVPVVKRVPFKVVKYIPRLVEKKIPIKIPVYKTVHHKVH